MSFLLRIVRDPSVIECASSMFISFSYSFSMCFIKYYLFDISLLYMLSCRGSRVGYSIYILSIYMIQYIIQVINILFIHTISMWQLNQAIFL
ncbi:hypothetical protein BDB01DRAFT_772850 [Pilobolus umbonatus]|nr:hypothetical protein BDB01DRAFT_772850 [Pilobolus umbonatus]